MLSSGNVQKNQRNFIKNRLFPDAMIFDFRLLFRFFRRISDFLIGTLDIPIAFGIFFKQKREVVHCLLVRFTLYCIPFQFI